MEGETNGESPELSPAGTLCPSGFDLPKTRQHSAAPASKRTEIFRKTVAPHLDIGGPDHRAPLLGIVGDDLAEVGSRMRRIAMT